MEEAVEHQTAAERAQLEGELGALIRTLSTVSSEIGHDFAEAHQLRETDLRALMHVYMADVHGTPLAANQLAQALRLTSAGGTYLVERLVVSGHLRRERHPTDRRKVLLRYAEPGLEVARGFFTPLGEANRRALQHHDVDDLRAALSVLRDVVGSMRSYQQELGAEH